MKFKMPPMNNVPIIGQPFKVFDCVPTAVMQCLCKPDNNPIIIPGVDVFKQCEHCQKIYGITAIVFNRRMSNSVTVTVSVINMTSEAREARNKEIRSEDMDEIAGIGDINGAGNE